MTSVFITVRLKASWHWAVWAATVITAHLHSDEMSPFGTCGLSECFAGKLPVPVSPYYVRCAYLCWGLIFLYWQPPCRSVRYPSLVEWRKCAGVLAAPQYCLPPGQGQLNGSVWPKKIPFLRGKWSVHNLGQWYLLVPHSLPLLLLPSSSFIAPLSTTW